MAKKFEKEENRNTLSKVEVPIRKKEEIQVYSRMLLRI